MGTSEEGRRGTICESRDTQAGGEEAGRDQDTDLDTRKGTAVDWRTERRRDWDWDRGGGDHRQAGIQKRSHRH